MKNFIFKAALCFVALGFLACDAASSSAPIEVQYMEKDNSMWPGQRYKEIRITALDDVKIMDVIANRGNCEATGMSVDNIGYGRVPKVYIGTARELKYGETWSLSLSKCSRLLEVEVITDKGSFEFKF